MAERPAPREPDKFEPGERHGWQHEAASIVEKQYRRVSCHASQRVKKPNCGPRADLWHDVVRGPSDVHSDRVAIIPSPPSAPSSPPPPSLRTSVLVWPSSRHFWPPPKDSWGGGGSQWRAPGLASAGRQVAEWSRMPCSEILTWQIQIPRTEDESRSWQTGCPCSEAPNWRWTPHSCLL